MTTTAITKDEFYELEYKKVCAQDESYIPEHYVVAKENSASNRYPDILPNEPTRVTFSRKSKYVNANWVLDKTAIASQGPRDIDLQNFFYMIRKRKVEVIVCLTNPTECGREKCFDYFSKYEGYVLYDNGTQRIVKREIPVKDMDKVIHFHLENWPDRGTVDSKALAALVLKVHAAAGGKIFLAHCSAGVGRTGAFLAAYNAHNRHSRDVFEIVKSLRHPETGRVGSVQNEKQYGLVYETLEHLSKFS